MSKFVLSNGAEVLFASASGAGIQAPGQRVEVFDHQGVDGVGFHLRGKRSNESVIDTWVDLLTANSVDTQKALYGSLKGELVYAHVGQMQSQQVLIIDVETNESALGVASGGVNDGNDPQFLLHAKWRVVYPYGR